MPYGQVLLDASGSSAAANRSLVAYSWQVRSSWDKSVVTSVDGLRTSVWLAPGEYLLELNVSDTGGQAATVSRVFSVREAESTTARIASPGRFVPQPDSGNREVQLTAAGSKAGAGKSITGFTWAVARLPDGAWVGSADGPSATVALPVGSYKIYLAVFDSAGGNDTTSQELFVGGSNAGGMTAVITWPPPVVQAAAAEAGNLTTIALDASGSTGPDDATSIVQYIWAVVSMPGKQPVAVAEGRLAGVKLAPGSYQVGLLVLDAQEATATVRKEFSVLGGSSSTNQAPVIGQDLILTGIAGQALEINGVTDPDGDPINLAWILMDSTYGSATQASVMGGVPVSTLTCAMYVGNINVKWRAVCHVVKAKTHID